MDRQWNAAARRFLQDPDDGHAARLLATLCLRNMGYDVSSPEYEQDSAYRLREAVRLFRDRVFQHIPGEMFTAYVENDDSNRIEFIELTDHGDVYLVSDSAIESRIRGLAEPLTPEDHMYDDDGVLDEMEWEESQSGRLASSQWQDIEGSGWFVNEASGHMVVAPPMYGSLDEWTILYNALGMDWHRTS